MQQEIKSHSLRGVIVPIVTPLKPNEEIDKKSLRKLVRYLIDSGVHGIWAAGTTGEFAALDDDNRQTVIETVVEEANGQIPIIANISAAATKQSIKFARRLENCPLTGIAATPPYYYMHTQNELIDHYHAIKEKTAQPLWIYNIPPTVKLSVEPKTVIDLAHDGTIIGIKDSSGEGEKFAEIVTLCRHRQVNLHRFIGGVWRTAMNGLGAHGVIPGIGNIVPRSLSKAWEAGQDSNGDSAQHYYSHVIDALQITRFGTGGGAQASSFSGIKCALKYLGIIEHDTISAPLRPLNESEKSKVIQVVDKLMLAKIVS